MIEQIDAQTLDTWMKKGEAVLIDVREPGEFAAGHIAGAISMPLSVFAEKYNHTDFANGKKIVFQCKLGGRSMRACQVVCDIAGTSGTIYNLDGGIDAWESSGHAVTTE